MSIFEQVREIVAVTLKVPLESVTANTSAADLAAWDSLGHVNLMMSLEQTFDLQLDVDDFPTLNSVPAILEHLRSCGIS
jgi:acyl carrier protein